MTVAELRKALEAFDDDHLVVMAKDAEGNSYSPLADAGAGMYLADTTWAGDVYYEGDGVPGGAVPAVVLGPTN
jgi:hypothetical protein